MFAQNLSKQPQNQHYPKGYEKEIQDYIYQLHDIIGQGSYNKVFRGYNKNTKEPVAIKVIDLKSIKDPIFLTLMKNEIQMMKLTQLNPNILRLHKELQTVNNQYIITELCNEGDLEKLIKSQKRLTEQTAIPFMKQLLNGFSELKNKSIIHRDIKPANIFISNGQLKIADFGFAVSKLIPQSYNQIVAYNVGTPLYMAPETLLNNQYSQKTDIWALGAVFFEMLYGQVPFYSNTEKNLVCKIKEYGMRGQLLLPQNIPVSNQMKKIIIGMLTYDYNLRWSLEQVQEQMRYFDVQQEIQRGIVVQQHINSVPNIRMESKSNLIQAQKQEFTLGMPIQMNQRINIHNNNSQEAKFFQQQNQVVRQKNHVSTDSNGHQKMMEFDKFYTLVNDKENFQGTPEGQRIEKARSKSPLTRLGPFQQQNRILIQNQQKQYISPLTGKNVNAKIETQEDQNFTLQ